MNAFVVDTNVPVVANGNRTPQASSDCVIACINALREIKNNGMVVIDDAGQILKEYLNKNNRSGQPGVGDMFVKWVWDSQAVEDRCERVSITPTSGDTESFAEFPNDPELSTFHRKDRKFVAVAIASQHNPTILNAVDPVWWNHREQLKKHVTVKFLCPTQ